MATDLNSHKFLQLSNLTCVQCQQAMQIPHWPIVTTFRKNEMENKNTGIQPASYPTVPDLSIKVGDRVRSFDFQNNPLCYFVGTVTALREDTRQYDIAVEYQVWNGEREASNYCASVHPPMNGVQGFFGLMRGVQRVLPGEE